MPLLYSDECSLQESPCHADSHEQWAASGLFFWNNWEEENYTTRVVEALLKAEQVGTTTLGQYKIVQFNELLFSGLVNSWYEERGITSSISDMVNCRSYLRIVGMGEAVLPLILAQLEREGDDPDHWFTALEAITGEDPVSDEARGDTVRMAEEWLSWAKTRNVW